MQKVNSQLSQNSSNLTKYYNKSNNQFVRTSKLAEQYPKSESGGLKIPFNLYSGSDDIIIKNNENINHILNQVKKKDKLPIHSQSELPTIDYIEQNARNTHVNCNTEIEEQQLYKISRQKIEDSIPTTSKPHSIFNQQQKVVVTTNQGLINSINDLQISQARTILKTSQDHTSYKKIKTPQMSQIKSQQQSRKHKIYVSTCSTPNTQNVNMEMDHQRSFNQKSSCWVKQGEQSYYPLRSSTHQCQSVIDILSTPHKTNINGRKEVFVLQNWLQQTLKKNEEDNNLNKPLQREKQLEIIQNCFNEFCKCIKFQCNDNEIMLRQLWDAQKEYYQHYINEFDLMKMQININADSEYNRVHQMYRMYIEERNEQIQKLNHVIRDKDQDIAKQKAETDLQFNYSNRFKEELDKYKKICIHLKNKLLNIQRENEILLLKIKEKGRGQYSLKSSEIVQPLDLKQVEKVILLQQQQQHNESQQKEVSDHQHNQTSSQQQQKLPQSSTAVTVAQKLNSNRNSKHHSSNLSENLDESDIGDNDNFLFEADGEKQDLEDLNQVIQKEYVVKVVQCETYIENKLLGDKDESCQTNLELINDIYNDAFVSNEKLKELLEFISYQKQIEALTKQYQTEIDKSLIEQSRLKKQNKDDAIQICIQNYDEQQIMKDILLDESQQQIKQDFSINLQQMQGNNSLNNIEPDQQSSTDRQGTDRSLSKLQAIVSESQQQQQNIQQIINGGNRGEYTPLVSPTDSAFRPLLQSIKESGRASFQPPISSITQQNQPQRNSLAISQKSSGKHNSILQLVKVYSVVKQHAKELKSNLHKTKISYDQLKQENQNYESETSKIKKENTDLKEKIKKLEELLHKQEGDLKDAQHTINQINSNKLSLQVSQRNIDLNNEEYDDGNNEIRPKNLTVLKSQKMIKQPNLSKIRRGPTKGKQFVLGQKQNLQYEHLKKTDGQQMIEKIKTKKAAKFHNFMTLKTVLKHVTVLYYERISQCSENPMIKEQEFSNFVYQYFLSQFGFKKIADQKFVILLLSVKKYLQIYRINVFAKFLGLLDGPANYTNQELNKYIEVMEYVTNQQSQYLPANDNDQKFPVSYQRSLQYITSFGDTRMKQEESIEFRRELEQMKEQDNKQTVIDFDQFMTKLLNTYRQLVNRAKTYVINAFSACDLDGNQMCNLDEWFLLNRHIEPNTLNDNMLQQVFEESADLIDDDGEKNLSFNKFALLSVEHNLFSDRAQNEYLGIRNEKDVEVRFELLVQEWPIKMKEILTRFNQITVIEQDEKEHWLTIIKVLNEKLNSKPKIVKPLLIAYNILDKESELLLYDSLEGAQTSKDDPPPNQEEYNKNENPQQNQKQLGEINK